MSAVNCGKTSHPVSLPALSDCTSSHRDVCELTGRFMRYKTTKILMKRIELKLICDYTPKLPQSCIQALCIQVINYIYFML